MAENRPAEAAFENLIGKQPLTDEELAALLNAADYDDRLFAEADLVRRQVYGDTVFVRGLIEFTNYCKNDCYYCGIRARNSHADRYRLTEEEILLLQGRLCTRLSYLCPARRGRSLFYNRTDLLSCGSDPRGISRLCYYTLYRRKDKRRLSGLF